MPDNAHRAVRFNLEFVRDTALLNLIREPGNEVHVIVGGNDGILITIDAAGHIHVLPPEGPGDPEVRQAVAGILQGVQVLNNKIGSVGQPIAA